MTEYISESKFTLGFYSIPEYIMRNTGLEEAQLESRLPGEISTSDMQMTPLLWQKVKKN